MLELSNDELDVFLEIEGDHLIDLVNYNCLDMTHIDVASFHVIFYAPRSADKDVDFPSSEQVSLMARILLATVDGEDGELIIRVPELHDLVGDLSGEFSSRGEHHDLEIAFAKEVLRSEILYQGKAEG